MSHPYRNENGLVAAGVAIALFAVAGAHSAPANPAAPCKLAPLLVPRSYPPFDALAERHAALAAEEKRLDDEIANFNASYGAVPENSPLVAQATKEQARLQERKSHYCAAVVQFNASLAAARRTAGRLQELRSRLVKTQQALAALGHRMNENSAELATWADVTADAVQDAEELGQELAMEVFVAATASGVKSSCAAMRADVERRLQQTAELLAKTNVGPPQAKLTQLLGMLKDEQAAVIKLQTLAPAVVQGPAMTRTAVEHLAPDVRRLLQAAGKSRLAMAGIAAAASGAALSPHFGVARISVQTAYDLTAISLAWSQIAQGNRNAELNLAAVSSLSVLVKGLIAEIKDGEDAGSR